MIGKRIITYLQFLVVDILHTVTLQYYLKKQIGKLMIDNN